jgi:hypothetical protein
MSTQTDAVPDDVAGGAAGGESPAVPEGLAEQLVAQAREQGIALTGPGGLLTGLTKQVLETALDAEMPSTSAMNAVAFLDRAATSATAARPRRCGPRSVMSGSKCRGIGPARSSR